MRAPLRIAMVAPVATSVPPERSGSVERFSRQQQQTFEMLAGSDLKTAFELDQRWVIELAADRTPDVCQSQSVNIFLPGDVDKWDLHMLHWTAWERGCKSLYYLRSKSVQRASHAGGEALAEVIQAEGKTDYEECLACQ